MATKINSIVLECVFALARCVCVVLVCMKISTDGHELNNACEKGSVPVDSSESFR